MKPIQIDWIRHLSDPQRQIDFEKTLRNNTLIFARLEEILNEKERSVLSEETSKSQYSIPAWSELQAHRNGNREIIKWLKDLISFT